MAGKSTRRAFKKDLGWYLTQWMAATDINQKLLCELTGWSANRASMLMSGRQDYNPDDVTEAAHALNIQRFELFMPPEDAMAMRRWRLDTIRIAADSRLAYRAEPSEIGQKTGTNG